MQNGGPFHSRAKEPRLNCPSCGTPVENGTAICPNCDYIIDSSFLDASSPAQENKGDSTHVGEAPPQKSAPARPRPAPRARPAAPSSARPAPSRPAEAAPRPRPAPRAAPVRRAPEPEPEQESEIEDAPSGPSEAEQLAAFQRVKQSEGESPEEALADIASFIRYLPTSDKLAFIGALGTLIASFFPWKETAQEGEVMGLMSLAFPVVISAALVIGAVGIRGRSTFPSLNPVIPWLGQLAASCFSILWTLAFLRLSWNGTQVQASVGNAMIAVSQPAGGAYLGLLFGLVALAGTLLGLKERPA